MTTAPNTNLADSAAEHELLTINEVADLLRIPPATVRYWRNIHYGPRSFRIGRHVRYRQADVSTWIDTQRNDGNDGNDDGPEAA